MPSLRQRRRHGVVVESFQGCLAGCFCAGDFTRLRLRLTTSYSRGAGCVGVGRFRLNLREGRGLIFVVRRGDSRGYIGGWEGREGGEDCVLEAGGGVGGALGGRVGGRHRGVWDKGLRTRSEGRLGQGGACGEGDERGELERSHFHLYI